MLTFNFEGSVPGESDQLWETTPYSMEELWYLKPDDAVDPLYQAGDNISLASTASVVSDQQLMFNINQLIVTVSAGGLLFHFEEYKGCASGFASLTMSNKVHYYVMMMQIHLSTLYFILKVV